MRYIMASCDLNIGALHVIRGCDGTHDYDLYFANTLNTARHLLSQTIPFVVLVKAFIRKMMISLAIAREYQRLITRLVKWLKHISFMPFLNKFTAWPRITFINAADEYYQALLRYAAVGYYATYTTRILASANLYVAVWLIATWWLWLSWHTHARKAIGHHDTASLFTLRNVLLRYFTSNFMKDWYTPDTYA